MYVWVGVCACREGCACLCGAGRSLRGWVYVRVERGVSVWCGEESVWVGVCACGEGCVCLCG